jgi:sugar lactone lactonase YvrE
MKSQKTFIKQYENWGRLGRWQWIPLVLFLGWASAVEAQVTFAGTQFGLAPGTWSAPASVAVDGHGNLYIADSGTNRVLEMSPAGSGFSAPVTILTGLSAPGGVATDWNGNVFVSDTGNGRIVMLPVSAAGFGALVTVAQGLSSPMGIALDAADNVFVAQSGSNNVIEIANGSGGYQAPMVLASGLNNPMGVALDSSRNLFIADTGNGSVLRELWTSTGFGAPQVQWSGLNSPVSLAEDKGNDLFIVLKGGQEILEKGWEPGVDRFYSSVQVGSGMMSPTGMAVNSSGQVFITDAGDAQVLELETASIDFGSLAVGSPASTLTYNFNIDAGVSLSGATIVTQGVSGKDFADGGTTTCTAQTYAAATVCGVSVTFTPLTPGIRTGATAIWGADGSPLATAFLSGVGTSPKAGFLPGTVTQLGSQLSGPAGVAVDGAGDVYIADTGNNRIVELPWTGSGYGPQTVIPVSGLMSPMGLAIDGAGNLYIASNGNDKVIYLPWTPTGFGTQSKVGSGLYGPSNVAAGADGTVYLTDTLDQRVDKIPWTGTGFAPEIPVGTDHPAPIGVAVDAAARVYISDPYQNAVYMVTFGVGILQAQVKVSVAGTSFPIALAVDANADLFLLDGVNDNLIMLPRNGTGYGKQMVVAGGFNSPAGMTIDSNGVLYIADTGNNRIVRIDMSAPGSLTYAQTYLGSTSVDSPRSMMAGNLGNLPVTLSAIAFPADFPEAATGANGCAGGTVLSASQWCELAIDFTPTVISPLLSETVTVTDNSFGMEGTAQQIQVSGASLAKAGQSIGFPTPPAVVYGAAPIALAATATSGLPVSFTVIGGPGVLTGNGRILRITGVGTVVVEAAQIGDASYSAAVAVTVRIAVAPASLTVTPVNAVATYGAIPTSFRYTIGGFVNGDNLSTVNGEAAIVFSGTRTAGAGSYPLQALQGSLSAPNYVFAFESGRLTVNPAVLQVRAVSNAVVYGKSIPILQWNLSGFVNGDSAAAVSGAPQLTTAANSGTGVGHYPIVISAGTLASANYSFALTSGTLTVLPALLTVTAASQTVSYGSALPALGYFISGFVGGDSVATAVKGAPLVTTLAAAGAGAGRYAVTVSQGSLSAANYSFAFLAGALTVEKGMIQVTPKNASMTYGGKMPELTYTMSGFVDGDNAESAVTGAPALIAAANSRSVPGTFPIAGGMGSLSSKNYSFVFGNAVLTVEKALLTVAPMPISIAYGQRVPVAALSYEGFVNGDGPSSLAGSPEQTPKAEASLAAGTYAIAITAGTITSAKYAINLQNGTLTVHPAVLTVEAQSASMTYGGKVPAFEYALRGFVNGDSVEQTSGTPGFECAVSAKSAVGVYPVTVTAGSLKAANYTFTFVNSEVTVTKAALTVVPGNLTITYGSILPSMTYSLNGLLNGDTPNGAVSGSPQFVTSATSASPAGSYLLEAELGSLTAKNYSFTFKAGTIAIGKATLTVTAGNGTMIAGAPLPALSYTMRGFAKGDTLASATSGKPSLTTSATSTSKAGSYPIVPAQGSLSATNYKFSFVDGTLTVSQ